MSVSGVFPFDIVVIPFPYSDRTDLSKRRPAVVVSRSAKYHGETGKIIVAMITSSTEAWPHDVPIRQNEKAGLHMVSAIRMKLFTLEQKHILQKIGSLGAKDRKALSAALKAVLVA